MGPPLFRGGHIDFLIRSDSQVELQWGHLSLEMVMGIAAIVAAVILLLQWGHLSLEVVIVTRATTPEGGIRFNGATSL